MNRIRNAVPVMALFASALGACSTTPDPAVVCTAEWIEPRAERALERIEDKADDAFRSLRKVGASYVAGGTPNPLALLSLRRNIDDLQDELRDGRGVKDLRLLARTCDDPNLIRDKVTTLIERQDIPDEVMSFLENTTLLDRLIELAERGDADTQR